MAKPIAKASKRTPVQSSTKAASTRGGRRKAAKVVTLAPAQNSAPHKPTSKQSMVDIQATGDTRNVAIDRVGVKDVRYPMRLKVPAFAGWTEDRQPGEQTTVATINMYVGLPHYQKGTHMSRFLEVLNAHEESIAPSDIPAITEKIRERLNAEEAHFEASFTYFIRKPAPVTGTPGLMDYKVRFICTASRDPKKNDLQISVRAPATSLCPCSKEISDYGAHNQRCEIEACVRTKGNVLWIEELVGIIEKAASCPVFAVLKRPDEKWVTEKAYENPKFVEDIIRDLALGLERERRIVSYDISSENFESIHSHNAYAQISRDMR